MAVFKNQAHWRERKRKIAKQNPGTSQPASTHIFFHLSWKQTTKQPSKQSPPPPSSKLLTQQRRRQTSPSGHGIHLKGWFSLQSSSSPTTFFTPAERDFGALRVRAGSTFMTTRSGRAATPCEVSEPAVSPRSGQLKPNGKWRRGGGGAPSRRAKRLAGRSSWVRVRRWAAKGLGIESCGKVLMPPGSSGGTRKGAFWRVGRL